MTSLQEKYKTLKEKLEKLRIEAHKVRIQTENDACQPPIFKFLPFNMSHAEVSAHAAAAPAKRKRKAAGNTKQKKQCVSVEKDRIKQRGKGAAKIAKESKDSYSVILPEINTTPDFDIGSDKVTTRAIHSDFVSTPELIEPTSDHLQMIDNAIMEDTEVTMWHDLYSSTGNQKFRRLVL